MPSPTQHQTQGWSLAMGVMEDDCASWPLSFEHSSQWQTMARASCVWPTASQGIATPPAIAVPRIDPLPLPKKAVLAPSSRRGMSSRGHGGPQHVGRLRRRPQPMSCSPRRNKKAFQLPCGSPYHPHGRPSSPYHQNGRQRAVTGTKPTQEQAGRREGKKYGQI
jgi:hypothetical protein